MEEQRQEGLESSVSDRSTKTAFRLALENAHEH